MTGHVDDYGRALLRVTLRNPTTTAREEREAWIDTGFTGELLLPRALVESLGLPGLDAVRAELGDGSRPLLDTYTCEIDWFGKPRKVEAIASACRFPMIGVGLLEDLE
jgi:clan AA aspartic protease